METMENLLYNYKVAHAPRYPDQLRLAQIEAMLASFAEVTATTATSSDFAARVAAYLATRGIAVTRYAARARSTILGLGEEQACELFTRVTCGEITLTQAARLARARQRGLATDAAGESDGGLLGRVVDQVCQVEAEARGMSDAARGELWRRARRILAAALGEVQMVARQATLASVEQDLPTRRQVLGACQVLGLPAPRHTEHGAAQVVPSRIKKRKKLLARTYHPDTLGGDRARFEAVIEAAELLERYNAACAATKRSEG